jgi:hypothetical protein
MKCCPSLSQKRHEIFGLTTTGDERSLSPLCEQFLGSLYFIHLQGNGLPFPTRSCLWKIGRASPIEMIIEDHFSEGVQVFKMQASTLLGIK